MWYLLFEQSICYINDESKERCVYWNFSWIHVYEIFAMHTFLEKVAGMIPSHMSAICTDPFLEVEVHVQCNKCTCIKKLLEHFICTMLMRNQKKSVYIEIFYGDIL